MDKCEFVSSKWHSIHWRIETVKLLSVVLFNLRVKHEQGAL